MTKSRLSKVAAELMKKERSKLPDGDYGSIGVSDDTIKLDGFKHMPGYNCQLSSLRKTLAYHGWEYTEEMLLGLASALGMLYWEMKLMPVPFIGALNAKEMEIFERATRRLGGGIIAHQTTSPLKAHQELKALLKSGKPAITFVDMAFLPYLWRDDAKIPFEKAHFGGHTVVVFGINEKEGTVEVSDRFDQPLKLPLKYLQMARASSYQPFPPRHKLVELRLPKQPNPLKEVLPAAIEANAQWMMNPPISNFGLKGFLKFKAQFPMWYKAYRPGRFLLALISTYLYMETGGSGGAWVRRMYSRFLRETAEVMKQPKFEEAASIFEEEIEAIRDLELAMLPDELPNIAEIRRIFLEVNETQERMHEGYRRRLRELDEKLMELVDMAKTYDYGKYASYISKVQTAIQKVYDIESKAWKYIRTIPL